MYFKILLSTARLPSVVVVDVDVVDVEVVDLLHGHLALDVEVVDVVVLDVEVVDLYHGLHFGHLLEVVVVDVVDVEALGLHVTDRQLHCPLSSPILLKMNLFLVMSAALLALPASPVGVPVSGRMTSGLE